MDNKYKEYNKIIEHMQGRYGKNTQYYNVILADTNNSIDKAIKELINILKEEVEEIPNRLNLNNVIMCNMFINNIKQLEKVLN